MKRSSASPWPTHSAERSRAAPSRVAAHSHPPRRASVPNRSPSRCRAARHSSTAAVASDATFAGAGVNATERSIEPVVGAAQSAAPRWPPPEWKASAGMKTASPTAMQWSMPTVPPSAAPAATRKRFAPRSITRRTSTSSMCQPAPQERRRCTARSWTNLSGVPRDPGARVARAERCRGAVGGGDVYISVAEGAARLLAERRQPRMHRRRRVAHRRRHLGRDGPAVRIDGRSQRRVRRQRRADAAL